MAARVFRNAPSSRRSGRNVARSRRCRFEALESRTLLAADITTGLAHHWKFDETAGDTAADSAGGSVGTLVNWSPTEPKWEPGRVGGALRFSTADNYVIAQPPAMSGSYAVSFWLDVADRSGTNPRIFESRAGNDIALNYDRTRGVAYYHAGSTTSVADPSWPTFNTWEHYAINFNAVGQGTIYRRGQPVAVGTFTDSASLETWVIGHSTNLTNTSDSLKGALDDLRVYNRLLTDEDIALLASLGTPEPEHQEPIHHWKFDETSGNTASDSAGNADGILLNWGATEPKWSAGKIGGALEFTTSDNAVITAPATVGAKWSVAFWAQMHAKTSLNPRVIGPQDGRELWAYFDVENNGGGAFLSHNQRTFEAAPLPLGSWEHYVFTYDTHADVGTIYHDGVAVKSGPFHDNPTTQAWVFGHNVDMGNHNQSLNGLLDDLRVYDRLLAPSEIADLADVPLAIADSYTTNEDTPLTVPVVNGVLANDSDAEGDVLTAVIVSNPGRGFFAFNANGSFTYTPGPNLNGPDSFTYRATDGVNSSGLTTVTINVTPVNDPPSFTKGPNQNVTDESGPQRILSWATAITAGPTDESAQGLSFVVTTDNLALFADRPRISPAGELTFTPEPNASGTATVSVVLRDSLGGTSSAQTFNIGITKPHPWRNNNNARDVNGDAVISPIDAVLVINYLNAGNAGPVPSGAANGPPYLDTDGDDAVSAIDAVLVINLLNSTGTLYGPIAYRSAADSPFNLGGLGTTFWLEDFEDDLVNTPGVSTVNGSIRGPSAFTDSVDGDDGVLNDDGRQGHSYLVRPGMLGVSFVFDPIALGGFPTRAGIVATTGMVSGNGQQVEFYDASGRLIVSLDHPVEGNGTASTDDDRFYGLFHSGGISKIRLINEGTGNLGIETDHLQYGDILPSGAGALAADKAIGALFPAQH